eukprot:70961-Chlamydomonas_euryale.AAC.1
MHPNPDALLRMHPTLTPFSGCILPRRPSQDARLACACVSRPTLRLRALSPCRSLTTCDNGFIFLRGERNRSVCEYGAGGKRAVAARTRRGGRIGRSLGRDGEVGDAG